MTYGTGARLAFKFIPGQGRYWKFRDAAKFELWELNADGERGRRVEVGPKQIYCLRDLEHTNPQMQGSPNRRVFPSCSQDPDRKAVTLGHLRRLVGRLPVELSPELDRARPPARESGCYAYVHIADPKNGIFELNEENNEASTVVYLKKGGSYKPGRCGGIDDKTLDPSQTANDLEVDRAARRRLLAHAMTPLQSPDGPSDSPANACASRANSPGARSAGRRATRSGGAT